MAEGKVDFPGYSGLELDNFAFEIVKRFQPKLLTGEEAFDIDWFIEVVEDDLIIDFHFTGDLLPPGIDGCTSISDNTVYINSELTNNPHDEKYLRSTIAHELGHVILHVPFLRELNIEKIFSQKKKEEQGIQLYRKDEIPVYKNPEWQAWRFAGALLMPEPAIRKHLKSGLSLSQIANAFMVNQPFLKSRLKALKIEI